MGVRVLCVVCVCACVFLSEDFIPILTLMLRARRIIIDDISVDTEAVRIRDVTAST